MVTRASIEETVIALVSALEIDVVRYSDDLFRIISISCSYKVRDAVLMLFLFYNIIFIFTSIIDMIKYLHDALQLSAHQFKMSTGRYGKEYHDWFLQFSACVSENKFLPSSFV